MLFGKPLFDDFGAGVKEQRVHYFGISFRQWTQLRRKCEDNVMMPKFGQLAQDRRCPVIGFILSAARTETILARMIDELGCSALGALIHIRTQLGRATCPDLICGFEDVRWNEASTFVHVLVPMCVQNFGEANHDGNITRNSNTRNTMRSISVQLIFHELKMRGAWHFVVLPASFMRETTLIAEVVRAIYRASNEKHKTPAASARILSVVEGHAPDNRCFQLRYHEPYEPSRSLPLPGLINAMPLVR